MKATKKYWYRIYRSECLLCGRCWKIRERVYGKRPKSESKRVRHEMHWCGCCYA